MYDWPEVATDTRCLEAALEAEVLTRLSVSGAAATPWPKDLDLFGRWRDPGLMLSQSCGYPLMTELHGAVVPVLTPHYAVRGCNGPYYRSILLARRDEGAASLKDMAGRRAAINGRDSQSGYNAFRHAVAAIAAPGPFFQDVIETGSHLASLRAVAGGKADVCSIDPVCWALAQRHHGEMAERLVPIGMTAAAPGLPFVTSAARSAGEIAAIRAAALSVLSASDLQDVRDRLFLNGCSVLATDSYSIILEMKASGEAAHVM